MIGLNSPEVRQTFEAWFDVCIKVLQKKIAILGIGNYRLKRKVTDDHERLFDSLRWKFTSQSEDSIAGELNFNNYGRMVDMGVGGNYSKGNTGNVAKVAVERKRKEWYSKIFYAQVMMLKLIYMEKYGKETANTLVAGITAVNDLAYNTSRLNDAARNRKNYRKQRQMENPTWTKLKPKSHYR
jgi:hypothetical protein